MAGVLSDSQVDVVELFNPINQTSCVITGKLDQPRYAHTGDGNLVCGGRNDDDNSISSCYNVVTGTTINLLNERYWHTSWSTNSGIYILGGDPFSNPDQTKTTELVTEDTTHTGQVWTQV